MLSYKDFELQTNTSTYIYHVEAHTHKNKLLDDEREHSYEKHAMLLVSSYQVRGHSYY